MELYLITGFLGAGKTTFLKNFVAQFKDRKIHLIINEFGATGVDGTIVKKMRLAMSEINQGSIFCACRLDQFEEELLHLQATEPEIVIVEASGLSDPTNVRKVLENGRFPHIDYRGSICMIDAARFEKVVSTARVVPKQLSVSSLALVNKTDLVSPEKIAVVKQTIVEQNPAIVIKETQFGAFDPSWLSSLTPEIDMEEAINTQDITLQKATITLAKTLEMKEIESFLQMIAEDTYRIKGFVKIGECNYLINCVGAYLKIERYEEEITNCNEIVALAGKGMPLRASLKNAKKWYETMILKIQHG
ncbi:MAG: GTP-binding protein [Bacillota bacterium]